MKNSKITTYPHMNKKIVGMLRIGERSIDLYAAARIEELEERLKGVVSEAKEMQELMYMWDLKGIAKDELEGYEQAVILELIEHCESIVSQLEKRDKP